jgi:multiple sugar transport system permease protein
MIMRRGSRDRQNTFEGLCFLAPSILGFLVFTLVPLVMSLALAFSNWDLKLHNMFRATPIHFVWFDQFRRLLFQEGDFWRFLGNTLFLMMGIPVSVAGSLALALLLDKEMKGGSRRVFAWLIAGAIMVAGVVLLTAVGAGKSAFFILICGIASGILVMGILGGSAIYRTLFFLPSFTSGVAVYLLWRKMYNPLGGPINAILAGPLDTLGRGVRGVPSSWIQAGEWVCLGLMALVFVYAILQIERQWRDGELGTAGAILMILFVALPVGFAHRWSGNAAGAWLTTIVAAGALLRFGFRSVRISRAFKAPWQRNLGAGLMLSWGLMVVMFILLGLGIVFRGLPQWSAAGLTPPQWLSSYGWAKPAIMIMGFWAAIGSNNMLLYLAGLSNVPQELYEAADMDGASAFQKFWHVTWPQLAPITFFIIIMSVIGGMQGGFDMARTMTEGGPAGATTTLSYFIYSEGFETGRLGFASAVAWTLFAMVFVITLLNWKIGSRYVND